MRTFFLLAALFSAVAGAFSTQVQAQSQDPIFGKIVNAQTGEPLPYATVVVEGREIGTLADKDGVYQLVTTSANASKTSTAPASAPLLAPTDTVRFSHIGFETAARTLASLRSGDAGADVALQPAEYAIDEIVVTNRKPRNVKLGHSSGGTRMFSAPFFTYGEIEKGDRVGKELGTTIKVRHDSKLLNFNMLISMNRYEMARFRLSIYAMNGDTPGDLIVHKDIVFEVTDRVRGRFKVDLTPYNIWLDGGQEVLASLTLLDEDGTVEPNKFYINGNLLSGKGIFRRSVGSEWTHEVKNAVVTMYFDAQAYPD